MSLDSCNARKSRLLSAIILWSNAALNLQERTFKHPNFTPGTELIIRELDLADDDGPGLLSILDIRNKTAMNETETDRRGRGRKNSTNRPIPMSKRRIRYSE